MPTRLCVSSAALSDCFAVDDSSGINESTRAARQYRFDVGLRKRALLCQVNGSAIPPPSAVPVLTLVDSTRYLIVRTWKEFANKATYCQRTARPCFVWLGALPERVLNARDELAGGWADSLLRCGASYDKGVNTMHIYKALGLLGVFRALPHAAGALYLDADAWLSAGSEGPAAATPERYLALAPGAHLVGTQNRPRPSGLMGSVQQNIVLNGGVVLVRNTAWGRGFAGTWWMLRCGHMDQLPLWRLLFVCLRSDAEAEGKRFDFPAAMFSSYDEARRAAMPFLQAHLDAVVNASSQWKGGRGFGRTGTLLEPLELRRVLLLPATSVRVASGTPPLPALRADILDPRAPTFVCHTKPGRDEGSQCAWRDVCARARCELSASAPPPMLAAAAARESPARASGTTALAYIAMGVVASEAIFAHSVANARVRGEFDGPVFVVSERAECVPPGAVHVPTLPPLPGPINADVDFKRHKMRLLQLLPASVEVVLYVDADVLVARPLAPFLREHAPRLRAGGHLRTQMLMFPEIGGRSGLPWHGGIFMLRRGVSEPCLAMWEASLIAAARAQPQERLHDQAALGDGLLADPSACAIEAFPPEHLCKPEVELIQRGGPYATFVHVTRNGRLPVMGVFGEQHNLTNGLLQELGRQLLVTHVPGGGSAGRPTPAPTAPKHVDLKRTFSHAQSLVGAVLNRQMESAATRGLVKKLARDLLDETGALRLFGMENYWWIESSWHCAGAA